jgi:hypothetical protein
MAPRKQAGKATKAEAVKGPPKGFPAVPGEQLGGVLKYGEPLGRHTTFRIGGPAAIHFQPATAEAAAGAVAWAKQHKVPWLVLGLGSNVLIRDGGFPGLVVKIAKGLDAVSHRAGTWKVGAGLPVPLLARKGEGKESKLSYSGNLLVENRNGLIVDAMAWEANGTAERDAALGEVTLALLRPPDKFTWELDAPSGQANLERSFYQPIVDALAEGPQRVRDLLDLPALAGRGNPGEVVGMLVGRQQATRVLGPGAEPDARNIRRYFPYRSVGLYRAGWGVRVASPHPGHSALNE